MIATKSVRNRHVILSSLREIWAGNLRAILLRVRGPSVNTSDGNVASADSGFCVTAAGSGLSFMGADAASCGAIGGNTVVCKTAEIG
jgi:hypothetical protein